MDFDWQTKDVQTKADPYIKTAPGIFRALFWVAQPAR